MSSDLPERVPPQIASEAVSRAKPRAAEPGAAGTSNESERLIGTLTAAARGAPVALPLDVARQWGRSLATSGEGLDRALTSIWQVSLGVVRDLLSRQSVQPAEMESTLSAWCHLVEQVSAALVHSYDAVREEAAAKEREELFRQAVHDGLTGLYNQRFFNIRLEDELARAKRHEHQVSLLMLDVDYFKLYNDTCGHLMGNDVLKGIAGAIEASVRRTDVVARFGGEEFVILLPETDREGAVVVAERMRQQVAEMSFPDMERQPLKCITVSLGCATFPLDAGVGLDLIRAADTALYEAKHLGRNRTCTFTQESESAEGAALG